VSADGPVRLLMSAGRGPRECAWAVARLLDRLTAQARARGLLVHRAEAAPGPDRGTYRSVLLEVSGPGAAAFAATWCGTLCWQAPSPYRASVARKNWYVIARRLDPPPAPTGFDPADVVMVGCRTGGPGGQHRNKVLTAVRATHRPSGLVVVVDQEREHGANRRLALELLRRRVEERDAAAGRAADAARWRTHDQLVRGDPVRVER